MTGVQTCALPISKLDNLTSSLTTAPAKRPAVGDGAPAGGDQAPGDPGKEDGKKVDLSDILFGS